MTSDRFTAKVNEMLQRNQTINEPDGWVQIQTSFYRELMEEASKVEPMAEALGELIRYNRPSCDADESCRCVAHAAFTKAKAVLKKAGLLP